MQYRTSKPVDDGFDDEDEEQEAMRDYVLTLMNRTGPNDIADTMLIISNICEQRALLNEMNSPLAQWYAAMGKMMRISLDNLTEASSVARPNDKLENPYLYFPDMKLAH